VPAYSSTDEPGALRGIENVPVVPKFEIAVLAGAVAGAGRGPYLIDGPADRVRAAAGSE
jgi:hypothetical protein